MIVETDRPTQTIMTRLPEPTAPAIGVLELMERPQLGPRLPQYDPHDGLDVSVEGGFNHF